MLAKKYRFHSRGGVRHTYQNGKTIRRPQISLIYAKNEKGFLRFGVVVSKKVLKSAVGRNRIRRRIYEAIRLNLPQNAKMDYIFIVYSKDVKDMPFSNLEKQVRSLIKESMIQSTK
ncbi:ribonuclease P protein component [Candidatus Saccharibacteria bacterium]|nr:ribonuclease P protein component [Candidatus Saccharibacteria bacterium]